MAKRNLTRILLLVAALATLVECNKSEASKPANLFGATPQVSDVVITKVRRHVQCGEAVELCCVDPPLCSCCCSPDRVTVDTADRDLVTATARVQDQDGVSNILVVILRFLNRSTVPPTLVSLEMFDTGPVDLVPDPGVQLSGDLVAGDGIYTRTFYFSSFTVVSSGACVANADQGGTFSEYQTTQTISPSETQVFAFTPQAIDLQGNIGSGTEISLGIQGTFREKVADQLRPCGPPSGNGGCFPGP